MKYLIVLLSSLLLCEHSAAASAGERADSDKPDGSKKRVSNASDLSEGTRAALADLDLDGDETAAMSSAVEAELKAEKESAATRNTKLKAELIALKGHDVEKDGVIALPETLAKILQELMDLEEGQSASKFQIGTTRELNKFKFKLTEADQEKVDAAAVKLSASE